ADPADSRDALGARVELNVDNDDGFLPGRTITRVIDGGSGFLGQNEPIAQFGVPTNGPVAVRVFFPDGSVVTHRDVSLNAQIEIRDVSDDRVTEAFPDVPLDCWAYEQVNACVDAGIVAGYDDARYHGSWEVTRDQMAVYIARALAGGEANVPEFTGTPTFPDVGELFWALDHVEYAVAEGVVGGYDDHLYHPEFAVDRGQMAAFMARAVAGGDGNVPVPSGAPTFPDVGSDFWAYRHIEYCVAQAIVQGYLDGLYHPEVVVTRDQMAVYVARAFGL
ncbi:MAG TPA: S-layer homology domain-containing protein, partial [Armatimonadota bacterium]|nr:S-layer homology domain-containing protein [Armatimonadota bacterium]